VAWAQTVQQDRRIEEEKRDSLQPTVALQPSRQAVIPQAAAPVPQPLKELYLFTLVQKRIAFRYDAAKAIVILMGVDEEYLDLTSQVAYLQAHGFIPKRYRHAFDPMEPLRKGVVASMVRQALGIRGGLALHLFGPTERYALKELAFLGIMAPGHVDDVVSGEELVQIMDQVVRAKLKRQPPPRK